MKMSSGISARERLIQTDSYSGDNDRMMKQKTVDKTIKTILFILLTIGSLLLSGCGKSGGV